MATGGFFHHLSPYNQLYVTSCGAHCVVFLACAQGRRKGRACECESDAGAAAGFRRVSGAFAATYTGQLAERLGKEG